MSSVFRPFWISSSSLLQCFLYALILWCPVCSGCFPYIYFKTNKKLKAEIMWRWFWRNGSRKIPSIAGDGIKISRIGSPAVLPLLFPLNFCSFPAYVAHLLHCIDFYRIIYLEQGFCLLCTCNAPHMHYYRTNLIQSVWDFMHRAACGQKSIWPKIPCFCAPSAGSEERETPLGPLLAFPHCHRAAPVPSTGGCLLEGVGAS